MQARDIAPPTVSEELAAARVYSTDTELISRLAGFASTLRLLEDGSRASGEVSERTLRDN